MYLFFYSTLRVLGRHSDDERRRTVAARFVVFCVLCFPCMDIVPGSVLFAFFMVFSSVCFLFV